MKKTLAYILVSIMLVIGIVILGGCGSTTEEKNDSKALALMTGKYYIKYETEDGEIIEYTQNGNQYGFSYGKDGNVYKFVEKDGVSYTISDKDEEYYKEDVEPDSEESLSSMNLLNKKDYSNDYTTGTKEIDGVKYDYEKFVTTEDDDTSGIIFFYFSGSDLKYIGDDETKNKVLEYSNKAKTELLEIPTNYTELTF